MAVLSLLSSSWWKRFAFFLICLTLSVVYVIPTIFNLDLEKTKFPLKQKINLGLDLQGGVYLVLGIDFDKVFADTLTKQLNHLKDRVEEKKLPVTGFTLNTNQNTSSDDPRMHVHCENTDEEAFFALIRKEFSSLRVAYQQGSEIELGLNPEVKTELQEKTVNQSIEVIRNRIDEFGVSEPIISSQGHNRIVVELPGVKEVDRAKDLIGRTAQLEFRLVDDQTFTHEKLSEMIEKVEKDQGIHFEEGKQKFSDYVNKINQALKNKIPVNKVITFERMKALDQEVRRPYLLEDKALITGSDLNDASVGFEPTTNRPLVTFSFNSKGGMLFEKITADNIGTRLAIVLDNVVHSAPAIQSKIPAGEKGQITLGGDEDPDTLMKQARDTAIVLRAGALPAQLDFLEQRVIGPSLGQDSIKKGALASLIGSLLIFIFVIFYYRTSGVIAVFSLMFNVLFVLALFVCLEATLTLPGIAGIALTVGIAVDSNVVIYERIREELRAGKRIFNAVHTGFDKAFKTILDANATNALASAVLMSCGTGPIKGFAVTLLIGIITTLFTSVFVCRLFFDFYLGFLASKKIQKLSI